ncbi:MAG: response regulator, partial [Elusimicrobiales bacterium]|nr:response regulator [Elusimicrobiales bacterium]
MNGKAKILVIDDDPVMVDMISAGLSRRGYLITGAYSGEEAAEKAVAVRFDVAILDIMMPGWDGIRTLGELKKIDPELEIIMATAHGSVGTAVQSLRNGAFDYISKPFLLKELESVVEKALEKRKFSELAAAIFSTLDPDELVRVILDSAARILKADDSALALTGPDGEIKLSASDGLEDEARRACRLELCSRALAGLSGNGPWGPVPVESPSSDPRFAGVPCAGEIKHSVFMPLSSGERPAGLINLNRTVLDEPFSESDMQRARIFCSLVSLSLRNAELYGRLKETQSKLAQTEKMSALGQLAGGIAHEINNPLSGILGLTQLVLEKTERGSQNERDLREIEKEVFRCKKIITSLLSFARQRPSALEPLDLNAAAEETLVLCARQLEFRKVKVEKALSSGLPQVKADHQQMMQVFLNLFNNAM